MELHQNQYYHIYNRSNNSEIVFRDDENYRYFLDKYRHYFLEGLDTIAYCLMPTHFHFLVYVKPMPHPSGVDGLHLQGGVHLPEEDALHLSSELQKKFGVLLSSYTKAINQRYERHGSLFQQHTKSRLVNKESYLVTVMTYIHQNPVRAGLVKRLEDWEYSSYRDFIGMRDGTLPQERILADYFSGIEDFKRFSKTMLASVEEDL